MVIFCEEFQPDYLEFYVLERSALDKIYFAWPLEAVNRNLLTVEGAIGIRTYPDMNVTVQVTIEIYDEVPTVDVENWQQVNECSLDIPSGQLTASFWGWDITTGDIPITPGCYRARVYYGNQSALDDAFRAAGTPANGYDIYRITLWPSVAQEFEVVKAEPLSESPRPTPPEFCHHIAPTPS